VGRHARIARWQGEFEGGSSFSHKSGTGKIP
jgi:hypothetical protein